MDAIAGAQRSLRRLHAPESPAPVAGDRRVPLDTALDGAARGGRPYVVPAISSNRPNSLTITNVSRPQ